MRTVQQRFRALGHGRVPAALGVALLSLSVAAGCGGAEGATERQPAASPSHTAPAVPTVPATPHYASVEVGRNAYVNACQAYEGHHFLVLSALDNAYAGNAVIQVQYAENALPASSYTTPADMATSTCSVELASSLWSFASPTLEIEQFGSPSLAAASFTQYKPQSQAELDKINQQYDLDLHPSVDKFTRVPGLADTYYQKTSGSSMTLTGNKIVEFNIGTQVPSAKTLALLHKAVPRAVSAVGWPKQSAELGSPDFGKHIGGSLYRNPCRIFTSASFQKATGLTADPTDVGLTYNDAAVSEPRGVTPDGIATNTCHRPSLPNAAKRFASVDVEVGYFDSAAQARHQLELRRKKEDTGIRTVSGMGPGAYTFSYAGITSLQVAHGPYTLSVSEHLSSKGKDQAPSLAQLRAAATATLPGLDG